MFSNHKGTQFWTSLWLLVILLAHQLAMAVETTSTPSTTPDIITADALRSRTRPPVHRLAVGGSNVTILHEVPPAPTTPQPDRPLELNKHEVLPLKPIKKKPYLVFDKPLVVSTSTSTAFDSEKMRTPLKEYELHPVTFDFNLGDFEDLEHENIKKGDLSAEEERLLRNTNDAGLTYKEHTLNEGGGLSIVTTDTDLSHGQTGAPALSTSSIMPTVITVSPHIFKILRNKTSKKGRELMKQEEIIPKSFASNLNSINRYLSDPESGANINATAESLHAVNKFQILVNLYDHFYWQAADIRDKVSTGCGLEMQAYLTALHGNYEWAQRAYDASGRYRGQMLFGNDKWLGEKNFCYDLNQRLKPEERRHFEFEFYMALVGIRLWLPSKLDVVIQIGECLPKSCTAQDVHAILQIDPHAHMLTALTRSSSSNSSTANSTLVQIRRVRTVPGTFNYWQELKFQVFVSFLVSLVLVVVTATWYQSKLHDKQLIISPIPAISAKIDAAHFMTGSGGGGGGSHAAKDAAPLGFELYQMNPLNGDNNNVVDVEANEPRMMMGNQKDKNALKHSNENGHHSAIKQSQQQQSSPELPLPLSHQQQQQHQQPQSVDSLQTDGDKSQMADTASSAGAHGPYEAKQPLALHEQILLCFAFQTNASGILSLDKKDSQTSCVHGLRVFSVLWTIMVHTYLQMFTVAENRYRRIIVERSIWYQFVGNATFSVDTFFFISGFLVTLLYLKQEKKYPEDTGQFLRRGLKDTVMIWIYRYLRLTPAYLFVILYNDFSLRKTFDDSVFQPTVAPNTCGQYWWRNILYINNFYPLSEICMIWSWYMANDIQFYLMATILLVLSTRYFKAAALTVITFLLSSWAISGIVSLQHHYTHKVANPFESFDFLYDKPWQRVGPYLVGMIAGYILYKVKTPPKISKTINRLLLSLSFGLLFIIIFGVWQGELNEINTAFYVSLGHTAFGLGLVWILLSCCWGLSPALNRILSYRGLLPLSRLTYCTYLIHPLLMLISSFSMAGTVHLSIFLITTIFMGNAVMSFVAAFFISVLFEAPVIRLLKISFRKR